MFGFDSKSRCCSCVSVLICFGDPGSNFQDQKDIVRTPRSWTKRSSRCIRRRPTWRRATKILPRCTCVAPSQAWPTAALRTAACHQFACRLPGYGDTGHWTLWTFLFIFFLGGGKGEGGGSGHTRTQATGHMKTKTKNSKNKN